ncbi:MAG: IS3 family transposase, partial [Armatimonadetes bacterium]|nr:IS3 family transposase [Armatimonadota bacterium]
ARSEIPIHPRTGRAVPYLGSVPGIAGLPERLHGLEGTSAEPTRPGRAEPSRRVRAAHQGSRGTYGSPRIHQELRAREVACSENRVARVMRKYEITARPLRRYTVTTDSNPSQPVAPNLLGREFTVEQPNTHGSADLTYLWTGEGGLYLAVVLDLYSRRVVGGSIQDRLDRSSVLSALKGSLLQRNPEAGLIRHSDRGSQYASGDYQALLSEVGALCSMSRKGNCYDNAPVESFFASLKRDLIHRQTFATREEARCAVFEWIAVWYNRRRRHSSLGYLSPDQIEQQHLPEMTLRAA